MNKETAKNKPTEENTIKGEKYSPETFLKKDRKENVIIEFNNEIPVLVEDWKYERPPKPKRRGGW